RGRILLALIDTFLVPSKLENAPVYNPRKLFEEEEPAGLCITLSEAGVATLPSATGMNDNDDDDVGPPGGGGGGKFSPQNRSSTPSGVMQRASSIPVGAATWFTSWFGNRLSSRSAVFTHPCVPLIPALLHRQVYAIQGRVLRSLAPASARTAVMRDGVACHRALLPLLFCPEEFGTNTDEVLRSLQQMHANAGGRKQSLPATPISPDTSSLVLETR
ncbi:putative synaptojanin (N-terminal domain), putative,inositol/phosphatidylinositol phosphatase, partial [Trypanosoma rangeli]